MKFEIEITPNDVANIVVDLNFKKNINSYHFLENCLEQVKASIEIRTDEIEQFSALCSERKEANLEKHKEVIDEK